MMHGGDLTLPNKRISFEEKEWFNVSWRIVVLSISIIRIFLVTIDVYCLPDRHKRMFFGLLSYAD